MALELIQNADDAKADAIVFDVTDEGLLVYNSGKFTYCGDLEGPCGFAVSSNYSCDFHRIADVGSGGKLSRGENIGRFGIGFVSTYQVTDHPEVRSSGIKLTLLPELGKWYIDAFEQSEGTTFFLPWASDPNTRARLALGVSHVSAAHIDQLAEDFQKVLRKSLLFLRHVRTAEVRRNGELLLACDLDRGDGSDLIVSFRPSGEVEQWHILRADVAEAAARLYASHPRLELLGRGTKISIGLRIDPEPLAEGVLYAFLPTEQSTGLPMHINADFFPESDRKAVIFAGHQHEQAWNEMLIDAAAAELARDPEGLRTMLGDVQLWQILARAFELSKPSNHPTCFKRFWERLKVTGAQAKIALAQDGSVQRPNGVFLPRGPLTSHQAKTLLEIGGRLVAEDLRPFQTAINQLGAPILTFDRLVTLLEQAMAQQVPGEVQVEADRLESFYRPLWSMVNDLLPDAANQTAATNPGIQKLLAIPFVVTEDLYAVTISQSFVAPAALEAGRVASLLPRLAIGVQTQTIEAFVQNVLPRFFNDDGPLDAQKYTRLITELASHPALVNDENIRRLLGALPIVPTQDGRWSRPTNAYRRTDDLVKVLGDATHLWLDASRVPNARSVHTFIDSLGIRRSPLAPHLMERILFIAEKYLPTEDAKRASGEAFYVLCDHYEEWKDKPSFRDAIRGLREAACFPAEDDAEGWYSASALYAPYRAAAFRSQARILDFPGRQDRLRRELLEELGITINPETRLVVNHLRHFIERGVQPTDLTYLVLNERAQDGDSIIPSLAGERCIYVPSQKNFVRPNQLYWSPQQLGRYAFTIPGNLEAFKPLFTAIGVKNAPEGRDYVDILLDIVGEYFEQSKPVAGADRSVYDACLMGVSAADEREEIGAPDIRRLQEAPTILNLMGQPTHPDEVLLQDSEWHAGFFNGELDRALCKPAPELWPFIEKVGVRRLSESAEVALEFVDGQKIEEPQLADKLMERIDVLARLLHDKPTPVKQKVRKALSELTAISYELVRIQASVHVGGDWASAPPSAAHAFYDIDKRQLILARPVGDRSWPHVLNAIFHQLMPEESGSEISKLTLSVRPLMSMPVDEAHRELTDAGIPYLDAESASGQPDDLTSSSLDDMGSTTDPGYQPESKPDTVPTDAPKGGERTPDRPGAGRPSGEPKAPPKDVPPPDQAQPGSASKGAQEKDAPDGDRATGHGHSTGSSTGDKRAKKSRPKHKEQWDRRLLSYVRKKQEESADADEQEGPSEHNLAVEVVARAAACAYEKARGRVAEQMAQTHPGYDIISRNPLTGEDRFIEVKGVNGEWNQTGVGLSRLQFSNAQDYGDRYWLYVVEFVSDPEHIRVHPIRSPATQVTSFMFDGNWRDAVADERADPALAFIAGARVKHQHFGFGRIESMELRGSTRVMSIEFVTSGRRTVTLNLQTMTVVEEDDDYSHS
ncbi:DUF3883 domain-containing protein [Hydrogenophaga sp. NH-16]|uniref:DUF3883 domain-containing protein n=1 Tax=Hydrogenophaga sp. NH-16 TaxID=2184519 RepID=UPI001F4EFCDD|nr:DUF3883 domain-containing protein [Hydrogenophaga sp. NH-16]